MKVAYYIAGNVCRELIFASCSVGRILRMLHPPSFMPHTFVKCQLLACLLPESLSVVTSELILTAYCEANKRVVS